MSQPIEKNNNPETRKRILQYANDVMHEELANNSIVVVAVHNRADPRKFTIVADSEYDRQLENVELIFNNPEDYKRIFPEFSAPPPVVLAPNMEMDKKLGVAVPIHHDPYKIITVMSPHIPANPKVNNINNILNDNNDEYWSVKANPATIIMDLGKEVDIGTLWIKWFAARERRAKFTVATATEEQYNSLPDRLFVAVDRLENKWASGTTDDFEPYNLSDNPADDELVHARYIMLQILGNDQDSDWASVVQVRVTKAMAVKSMETELQTDG